MRSVPEDKEKIQSTTTTVSDVIISELEKWGITFIFGIPGGSSLGLVDSIRRNTRMHYIVVRHEQAAAFAASAYNKLTGRLAACLTIAGPGATNLATGLYDAKEDSASVLSLNGQVEAQYVGPGGFQEIDQDAFFRPITIFNNTIYEKKKALKIITMALKYAVFKKGVAQVSIPNDLQKEPLDIACCEREMRIAAQNIIPEDQEIIQAAAVINEAKKPVILAGWGAFESSDMVLKIAQKLKAPIITTFRAKGILPEKNEWVLGILGDVGSQYARSLVNTCDLLITLGVGFSKRTNVPFGKPIVQVDIDPIKLGKYPFKIALLGNCNLILPRLYEKLDIKTDLTSYHEMTEMKQKWYTQLDQEADSHMTPIRPPYIMKVLSEELPEDAVITIDVGENGWWFGRNFVMKKQRFAMSGYLATMGFALPGALAAKLAYPEKAVVCITGDGGFSMTMGDFVTAVKYKLPMVVLVLNNKKLAMIELEQRAERFPVFGIDLLNPDFAAYARACGGMGIRVTNPGDVRGALQQALKKNVPTILDVDTDSRRFLE
jgi:pyruvate oxidase